MTYLHVLKAYRSLTQCCSFTHIHTRYTQSGGQWLAKREVSFKENAFIFPTSRLRVILSLRLGRAIQSKPQSLQEKKGKIDGAVQFLPVKHQSQEFPLVLCTCVCASVCVGVQACACVCLDQVVSVLWGRTSVYTFTIWLHLFLMTTRKSKSPQLRSVYFKVLRFF